RGKIITWDLAAAKNAALIRTESSIRALRLGTALLDESGVPMARRRDVRLPALRVAEAQLLPSGIARRDRASHIARVGRDRLAAGGAPGRPHGSWIARPPRRARIEALRYAPHSRSSRR